MSDETTDAAGTDPAASPPPLPNVRITAHYIRDLSFENVAAQKGLNAAGKPEVSVTVNLDATAVDDTRFQVAMQVNASATANGETRFMVELDYIGIFEVQNVPKEHVHPFLFIECPRQLLPYARRVVSDVTRDGGYPPLMLDNIDFAALYKSKLDDLRTQGTA